MIQITKANEEIKKSLSLENDAFVVLDKDEILGFCEFKIDINGLYLIRANCEVPAFLDGLFRQTMNQALLGGSMCMTFEKNLKTDLFKLKIIQSLDQETVNLKAFFDNIHC